jgi:tyrosine-protein kinase Etk/Wzc
MTEQGTDRLGHDVERSMPDEAHADSDTGLIDLLITLGQYKRLLFGLPFGAAVVAAVTTLFLPSAYTAFTTFLPPQQQQSITTATLQQLGGLASIAGVAAGIKKPEDLHAAILRSASIQDALIKRFDLMKYYGVSSREQARKSLTGDVDISIDKAGLLKVEVTVNDPEFAARLANAYVEELQKRLASLAITEAQQRRAFFDQQLLASKEALIKAEIGLKQTQERTGLIVLDKQGEAMIKASADLRAQIVGREVQLQAMRNFATPENAEIQRIQSEIVGFKSQLSRLENAQSRGKGDLLVPSGKVPEAGLELVRALREVKYQEAIFEVLARQYELAKLDEAREGPIVQQVDAAFAPEFRSKPKRRQIVLMAAMAAAFAAVLIAFALSTLESARADAVRWSRLQALCSSWRIGWR